MDLKTTDYLVVLVPEVHLDVFIQEKDSGHLGNANVTLKNTKIIYVNEAENILVVKGSVPGKRNNILKLSAPKTY